LEAFVLIQTEMGREPIAHQLLRLPGIVSAEDLSGAYDAIARARSSSTRHLVEQVIGEIRKLPGVTRVLPAPLSHPSTERLTGPQNEAA
jgi:DNA-binding Lrp family transcriptional regulator